jgi:ribosome biogenesis GTPase
MSDRNFDAEDDFHEKDRKASRKERKLATTRDRSKFKKSDQDQIKKRAESLPPPDENLTRGLVLAVTPEGIVVDADQKEFMCALKGILKKENLQIKNLVAVGDYVHFAPTGEKAGVIAYVEPRRSVLSRADNLSRRKEQLIAVNIDQVLITCSVVLPALKPFLIDRYIIAAHKGNMQPIIVVNKIDFPTSPPDLFYPIATHK